MFVCDLEPIQNMILYILNKVICLTGYTQDIQFMTMNYTNLQHFKLLFDNIDYMLRQLMIKYPLCTTPSHLNTHLHSYLLLRNIFEIKTTS